MSEPRDPRDPKSTDLDVPARHITPLPPLSTDELDSAVELPPDLEGEPMSEELTGRAARTEDDLNSLFSNQTEEHLDDGFSGGSGDAEESSLE